MSEKSEPLTIKLSAVTFSLASFLIVNLISYGLWLFLIDPKLTALKSYPQPSSAYIFWGIMVLCFLGFNCEMWGFSKMKQPASGIAATIFTVVGASIIIYMLVSGLGSMDPAFSGPGGYGPAGLIVLIGFYGFGVPPTGMAGWPWSDYLKQPMNGITQIFFGFFLTVIGYLVLIYPSVASWTGPDKPIMSLTTAIGWFYCGILIWLTTFMIWGNWPWSAFGSRAKCAMAALFGNLILGTVTYFVLLALLKNVLIPPEAVAKIGAGITLWPAELGVYFVMWCIFWPNVTGNWPTRFSPAANMIVRFIVVYGLGTICFLIHMHWFGVNVLHEPEIVPGFGGDPLVWVDLVNLVMLVFIVYFGFYPLARKLAPEAEAQMSA